MIQVKPYLMNAAETHFATFYELPLHMKIIHMQALGLTLRETAKHLKLTQFRIHASILAWLRED